MHGDIHLPSICKSELLISNLNSLLNTSCQEWEMTVTFQTVDMYVNHHVVGSKYWQGLDSLQLENQIAWIMQ